MAAPVLAAPLPPERPAEIAAARPSPPARSLRRAPLPPPLPPELRAARAAAEEPEPGEADAGDPAAAEGQVPLPPRPPGARARSVEAEASIPLPSRPPGAPGPEAEPDSEPETAPPPTQAGRRSFGRVVPLPPRPPRPRDATPPPAEDAAEEEADAAPAEAATADVAAATASCRAFLAGGIVAAVPAPPLPAKPGCNPSEPVQLAAVFLADGRRVDLKPAAIVTCDMAKAVADWVRGDLASGLAAAHGRLAAVQVAGAYECRPRNRQPGAPMSEHGSGNAFDVGGFELASGSVMKVAGSGLGSFAAAMKESACRRFTTVLGPGSDGFHEDHIHVDLARRNGGYRLCRWQMKGEARTQASRPGRARSVPD